MSKYKPPKGWKSTEDGWWYPTKKWLKEFKRFVDQTKYQEKLATESFFEKEK